jgi:hypothetical protein
MPGPGNPGVSDSRAQNTPEGVPAVPDFRSPIPAGHIVATGHGLWFEAVQYLVEAAGRRADWTRNALRFAWQLMRRSTWAMLTTPLEGATWKHLAGDLGVSERTIDPHS